MIRPIFDPSDIEEPSRDLEIAEALTALDPLGRDPNYWLRFRWWVMSSAASELARRRLMTRLTVGDVMESWARAIVPTAVLAAALAAILLVRGEGFGTPGPIGVEEQLVSEVEGEPLPVLLDEDEANGAVAFASEIF